MSEGKTSEIIEFDIDRVVNRLSILPNTEESLQEKISNKISSVSSTAFVWERKNAPQEVIDDLFQRSMVKLNEVFTGHGGIVKQEFEKLVEKDPDKYEKYMKFFEEDKPQDNG